MRNRQLEIARLGRENKYSWGIPDNEGFVTFKKKSSERCLQYIFRHSVTKDALQQVQSVFV